jgi:hypothetical protein
MARSIYAAPVGAAVALVATTAKTILAVIASGQAGIDLRRLRIGFDGVTATDKAVLVELVRYPADGTGTAGTIAQTSGRAIASTGFTTKYNYSVEPASATVLDKWLLTPQGGTVVYDFGDDGPDAGITDLLAIRCTAPTSAVNATATMWFGRC